MARAILKNTTAALISSKPPLCFDGSGLFAKQNLMIALHALLIGLAVGLVGVVFSFFNHLFLFGFGCHRWSLLWGLSLDGLDGLLKGHAVKFQTLMFMGPYHAGRWGCNGKMTFASWPGLEKAL
jgi:hypothetical protein